MAIKRITTFTCDMCGADLPEEYKNTDGEGGSYFIWDTYNEVHWHEPIKECNAARIKVTLGGKDDDHRYTDLCNKCKLKVLRKAVAYYEEQGLGEKEQEGGADNEREEADVQPT